MQINKWWMPAIVSCYVLSGCASGDEPTRSGAQTPVHLNDVGGASAVRDVQLVRVGDDPVQQARRLKTFGKLLLGGNADEQTLERLVRLGRAGAPAAQAEAESYPSALPLRVTLLPHNDETLVVNSAVTANRTDCEDVGEDVAREAFERALDALRAERAPEVEGLDLAQVHVARLSQGA